MKKILSLVLALVMAGGTLSAYAENGKIKGDIDGNGAVDIEDVTNVIASINGISSLEEI